MRVAMIGAGLQGKRRAPAVQECPTTELVIVTAAHLESAARLASSMGCEAGVGWKEAVTRDDIDAVVVCTPPDTHAAISNAAARAGKHVLCEKPLAQTIEEAERMVQVAESCGVTLKCGFNHRHHPAIRKAKELVDAGFVGQPISGRCRYGIGGRPEYEKEWRADPRIAAGGHLMEQGIHGMDLFRWFLGEISEVMGFVQTAYWNIEPLEDNGYALLRCPSGAVATLHSSLTQWKNLFSFEIVGGDGYLEVDGLGASYGTERLIAGKRDFYKPFTDEITEFRGADRSWQAEWNEFVAAVREGRDPVGNGRDGVEAMRLVHGIYASAGTGRAVSLRPVPGAARP